MGSEQKIVVITGASGLLGRGLVSKFENNGWGVAGLAFSRAKGKLICVDLNKLDYVKSIIQNLKPAVIVHAAAERNPDKVEKDLEACKNLNVICSKNLAEVANELGTAFIYISTDYVFDGTNPPYSEMDKPNPLNQYGVSKLEGEEAVISACPDACVLRIPVIYGDEEFLGESAISCLIKNFEKKDPIKVSNFEVRYPSHVDDIASICVQLSEQKLKNPTIKSIYHWCGEEPLTKYEMTKKIAAAFNQSDSHISPDDNPSSGTPRPKNTQLSCGNLKDLGIGQHTTFDEGIRKSFSRFFTSSRA